MARRAGWMVFLALLAPPLAPSLAPPLAAQVVRGRVIDARTSAAVSGADLAVVGNQVAARSDDSGKFVLAVRTPGTVVMTVRRIGYQSQTWTFTLGASDTADATLPLQPAVATLDTVAVRAAAAAAPFVADFERRRQQKKGGTFITRADIDGNPPTQTAELLRRVPSVDVRQKGMQTVVVSRRGPASLMLTPDMCVIPLGRDGMILGPNYNINDVPANEIYGIEVYGGPATIPAEYRNSLPNGVCGLVMIWTRTGASERSRSP